MDVSFGTRLRSQRERQQVALAVIAERTKIKASLLEGLERDDVSQWPTGIFRRSFVRSYAQAIGLEPDTVLREFLEQYPEPVEEDIPAVLAAARESRRPPTRLGYLISSAMSALPAVRAASARTRLAATPHPDPAPYREAIPTAAADDAAAVDPQAPCPLNPESAGVERDLSAVAELCTRLACVLQPRDVTPVLEDAVRILHAVGLIVWMWDPTTRTLRHALAHGYSSELLARLPRVRCDTDNAIADAYRSADTRVVKGSGLTTGAVVAPIVTAAGCAGVLALEFQDRGEERESVRALAAILAAQLATLCGFPQLAEAVSA